MSQQTEEYFPRGGFKTKSNAPKRPKQENLFNASEEQQTKSKAKKVRREKNRQEKEQDQDALGQPHLLTADVLTYKKIQEGMLVLGCIRKVKTLSMEVELPGRLHGTVLIKLVSTQYSKELNKMLNGTTRTAELPDLNQLFKEGQYIPTKVVSIEIKDKGTKVWLSIKPSDINSLLQHAHIKTGMLVWGSVLEKSDHGYIVDLGVSNCRVLLPFTEVDEGVDYKVGQPFYSVVTKCDNLKEASTLSLTALKKNIDRNFESSELSLDHVIPGMQVEYVIDKILKHGLEGKFFDKCLGYINDLYLNSPLEPLKKYHEDQTITARVLYVQPTTKFAYLTLRSIDTVKRPTVKIGQKLKSHILARIGNGVVLKISNTELGFVTYKRILKSLNAKETNVKKAVSNKFAVGTEHRCIILDYNQIEKMYICTFEGDLSKDCIFNKSELAVGQTVSAVISEIKLQGLLVKVGSLQAFINNIHLSNSAYSENIKSKFKIGQKLKAKVWYVDPKSDNIKLTIKPELMNCNEHLSSCKDAVTKKEYLGMVVKGTKSGVLVVFFNDLRGWLPKEEIPQLVSGDATNIFYEGQIIKCSISKNLKHKLELTMKKANAPNGKSLSIGKVVKSAKVVKASLLGLDLLIKDGIQAFLPTEHLACGDLGHALLGTYKEGDEINDLICIGAEGRPILSLTEYKNKKMVTFNDIHRNMIVRCYYNKHIKNDISVFPGIKFCQKKISINVLNAIDDRKSVDIKFVPYQVMIAKVTSVDKESKTISLRSKLSQVFSNKVKYSIDLLETYLSNFDRVVDRLSEKNYDLAKLRIGQHVSCVVNKYDPSRGCSVFIQPGSCQGIVELEYCPDNICAGSNLKGVILGINFKLKFALVGLVENVIRKIKKKQDAEVCKDSLLNETCFASLLTVNRDFALGVITNKEVNGQLLYMPVRLHENDYFPNTKYYDDLFNKRMKVVIYRKSNGRLIGVEKGYKKIIENKKAMHNSQNVDKTSTLKGKRKLENENVVNVKKMKLEVDTDEGIETDSVKSEPISEIENEMEIGENTISSDVEKDDEDIDYCNRQNNSGKIEGEDLEESSADTDDENDINMKDDYTQGAVEEDESCANSNSEDEETKKDDIQGSILPGIENFFQAESKYIEPQNLSSDDDADDKVKEKKKKLSAAEKAESAKAEEERLRIIETELADSSSLPQSADQFDRVLLGDPDNSEMWLRYIAFHAQATEFEKGRAVAKRALERISYTAIQERLNVWITYLNLENMYGTKDSFDTVFQEACRCNDSLTIYLEAIKMLCEMQKFSEMDEKIKKIRAKFKQELQMWLEVGKVYYQCKRFADARKLKDVALLSITDRKTHMNLLVQFAVMEFNYGEANHGEALFETIIQTDPKRVDVWCTYIDQLIKLNKIDLARNVMQRAAGQKLTYKKMKTLFKKYHSFEKTYGDEDSLEQVKKLLQEYGDE